MREARRNYRRILLYCGLVILISGSLFRYSRDWDFAAYRGVETEEALAAIAARELAQDRRDTWAIAAGASLAAIGAASVVHHKRVRS